MGMILSFVEFVRYNYLMHSIVHFISLDAFGIKSVPIKNTFSNQIIDLDY